MDLRNSLLPPSGPVYVWEGRLRRPWGFKYTGRRKELGAWGEWVALKHLQRLKWDVLVRNWRCKRGEIDLAAYDEDRLVFLEVRTRWTPSPFRPEESVDSTKEAQLERLAWDFVRRYEMSDQDYRLDMVAIETPDLRRFQLRHYHL